LGKQQTELTTGLGKSEPIGIRLGQSNMYNSRSDGRVGSLRRPEHTLTISTKRDGRVGISVRAGQYPISSLRTGNLAKLSHHLRFKVIKDWNGPNRREIIFGQNDIESVFRHGKPPASVPGHSDHSVIYFISLTVRYLREGKAPSFGRCLDSPWHIAILLNMENEVFPSQLGYFPES